MFRVMCRMAFVAFFLAPLSAAAQGVLIDIRETHEYRLPRPLVLHPPERIRPPRPEPHPTYQIKELGIHVNLQDQVAKVQMTQAFENTGSRQLEVCFVFPLPYDGAIDRMTFMVDGKEYEAKLLNADEARRIYEGYVRRNQDPALVEWMGTGMFKTSVFPVPPGATRTVTLKFTQLCRKHHGLTELTFPLSTAKYTSQPLSKVSIEVALQSQAKIKNIYSPSHAVQIQRPNDHTAQAKYSSVNEIPTADFRLLYDVGDGPIGANVISHKPKDGDDGYFLLLVSPEIKRASDKPIPKTVVFVVDRSGSMSGKKIEQAKGALRFVLNNLRDGDLFNIVAYDNAVESFRPELQKFNDENRQAALGFVEGIYAGGSTNIDGALQAAMGQLQDDSRPNYIVFLTDGLPTAGERQEARIAENARQRNQVRARVFSFGVGYDVNSRLLDKISRTCHGQSHYVRPNEDIESHVGQLYSRIAAPVMTNVTVTFDMENFPAEKGNLVSRVYPREIHDLFAGDQLVIVGRYKQGGDAKVTVKGSVEDTRHEFHFPAKLAVKSSDDTFAFAEKLWALRRVGEIIDEIDLHGKNQELIDELVALSKKHGILTPYTSFLADENVDVHDLARNRRRADDALESLSINEGRAGFVQRDIKRQLQLSEQAAASGLAPAASTPSADSPSQRFGLGGGGFAGGMAGMPGMAGRASTQTLRQLDDTQVEIHTVRQVADKTFYRRDGRWVDSSITQAQEEKIQRVKRYSKEYFDLLSRVKNAGKYVATDDEVVVVLEGQAYAF